MRRTSIHCHSGTVVGWLIVVVLLFILFAYVVTRPISRPHPGIRQRAQFNSIRAAMELFDSRFGSYTAPGATGAAAYCGSLKLCESMMGQDLMGYHPASVFRSDGTDGLGRALYTQTTLGDRPGGGFLPLENANAYPLGELYKTVGPFDPCDFVLCNVYNRVTNIRTGRKVGMPILYYRANPSGTKHNVENPDDPENIYDYRDNLALIALGVPGDPKAVHPLADPRRFYLNTQNTKVSEPRPHRGDSYMLIGAGYDGLYGTADDVCNFEWRYREGGDARSAQ